MTEKERNRIKYSRRRYKALCMIARSDKPCCVRCGCDDERFLEINHKNGGGNKEHKSRDNIERVIVNGNRSVEDLEILCRPCNAIHALELRYGSVPLMTTFTKRYQAEGSRYPLFDYGDSEDSE